MDSTKELRDLITGNEPFSKTVIETCSTEYGQVKLAVTYHRDEDGAETLKEVSPACEPISLAKMMTEARRKLKYLNKVICPCATDAFNGATEGFKTGTLWLIGGETGAGKTQLALGEAIHAAELGKKVLYITTEMDVADILERVDGKVSDDAMANISIIEKSSLTTMKDWELTVGDACWTGQADLILIDYINPATIQMPEELNIPDDQKIAILMESIRRIIRGSVSRNDFISEDLPLRHGGCTNRKVPCVVIFTQLNRTSKTSRPDATVIQGSYSSAFKADFAACLVKANSLEKRACEDITIPKGFVGECSRMLYIWKNRNVNDINDRLCWMSYEPKTMSFSTIKYADGYDIDWKALGRE